MKRAVLAGLIVAVVWSAVVLTRPPEPQAIKRSDAAEAKNGIERGRLVYEQYGCGLCHGDDGKSGIANLNSETEEKIPAVVYVQEGYTKPELRNYLLKGNQKIGKEHAEGPTPPYKMPLGLGRMTRSEAADLAEYLWSLYPEKESQKW